MAATPPAQQSLQLILARNLISTLSTPAFLVDNEGTVVFYNEAAGDFLGTRYEETGRLPLADWRAAVGPIDADGNALGDERMPITAALEVRRPVHGATRTRNADGAERDIEMLALPLIGTEDHSEGAVGVFWPRDDDG